MPDDDPLASAPTLPGGTLASVVGTPNSGRRDSSPSLVAHPPTPAVLANRYEVLALLGVGGMGRVYRVHDRALDETVALKLLRRELVGEPAMAERFRREVKLARMVTSPFVVRTFDLGEHAGEHFLTMELVEGRALAQLVEPGGIAMAEVLRIARAIASGLAAAHAAGVLHRDLKPDNVLVGPGATGRIAITDFGIARAADSGHTVEGFVGTPAYMAPEQIEAGARIGPATDVYAFGLVVYELLVGQRAFTGGDALQVAIKRLTEPTPDPSATRALPPGLRELVMRCLARDPAARFADAGALRGALDAIVAQPDATRPHALALAPAVPTAWSRAVAVLPLRASAELAELAEGLGEEIVDALTMTRALRVRPMSSVRAVATPGADPRELGRLLGVDVVVDGSLRKHGDIVRIAARAIGVADGFQLSADRIDARGDELLAAGDTIARAVARALTVELPLPVRPAIDPRATELYLEGKARTRAGWMGNEVRPALAILTRARALAPDDASIAAAYAIARARDAFYGTGGDLSEARAVAERIVEHAPDNADAWLALGLACTYACELAPAAAALERALRIAPGLVHAQQAIGSILLEVGALGAARAHLGAAVALDPTSVAIWDQARLDMFEGRDEQAIARLAGHDAAGNFAEILIGRFHQWAGRRYVSPVRELGELRPDVVAYASLALKFYATGVLTEDELSVMASIATVPNPRLRSSRMQFAAEFLCAMGQRERAFDCVREAVASGLHDHLWLVRCPVLGPVRAMPGYGELAAIVAARADTVRRVIGVPDEA